MASFITLPDEMLLHIIKALFHGAEINITKPREDSLQLAQPDRPNLLRVTAVNHHLRSLVMGAISELAAFHLSGPDSWGIKQYHAFLQAAPPLLFVASIEIIPKHGNLHLHLLNRPRRTEMPAIFSTTFPQLSKITMKSEASDLYGLISKPSGDCAGMERYSQETKFVDAMIKKITNCECSRLGNFLQHDACGMFERRVELTFTQGGKLECIIKLNQDDQLEITNFGSVPDCIWAKRLCPSQVFRMNVTAGRRVPAVFREQDRLYRRSLA